MCLVQTLRKLIALAVLGLFICPPCLRGEPALPPAPAGFIMDKGQVLLPEHAAALSRRLQAAAAERGIWVYVVTVPTLGVPPSKQRERLVNMGDFYRDGWLQGRVGVVLLVDDESGAAMLAASDEANRQYPPLQRNLRLEDPLRLVQQETLRRDKVEKTALAVVEVISRLQDETKRTVRRDRLVSLAMAGMALAGLGTVLLVKWMKAKRVRDPSAPGHH